MTLWLVKSRWLENNKYRNVALKALKKTVIYIKTRRRQVFSFFFWLGVSALLWYTIKLNRQYSHNLTVAIEIVGLKSNQHVIPLQEPVINLEVKTQGYNILFSRITKTNKKTIEVGSYMLKPVHETNVSYITAQSLFGIISSRIQSSATILTTKPDTLYFNIEELVKKRVPVMADTSAELIHGYGLKESIRLIPDSVFISGEKGIVEDIYEIKTATIELPSNEGPFRQNIELINPLPEKISISQNSVQAIGIISQFVEKNFTAKVITADSILFVGIPKNLTVEVKCYMPVEEAASFNPLSVEVIASEIIKQPNGSFTKLELKCPSFIRQWQIIPEKIAVDILND